LNQTPTPLWRVGRRVLQPHPTVIAIERDTKAYQCRPRSGSAEECCRDTAVVETGPDLRIVGRTLSSRFRSNRLITTVAHKRICLAGILHLALASLRMENRTITSGSPLQRNRSAPGRERRLSSSGSKFEQIYVSGLGPRKEWSEREDSPTPWSRLRYSLLLSRWLAKLLHCHERRKLHPEFRVRIEAAAPADVLRNRAVHTDNFAPSRNGFHTVYLLLTATLLLLVRHHWSRNI
jgi:hypothetical protein